MYVRIIPRLDIKGPNLVKGIHFEGLRVLGKPEHFAKYYYENGADELFYQDAVASLYGRNSLLDIIQKTSGEIFIPLCVGGGLRNVEDIRNVLRAGADKVAINTAAIKRPELIKEASRTFGSSTIVVSIEAIKTENNEYEAYIDYGRERTGVNAIEWAQKAVEYGAGELMVTSIDKEGTGEGYDINLIKKIATSVKVPVIAAGGCGQISHAVNVVKNGMADAISLASILHYHALNDVKYLYDENDFEKEGNIEFVKSKGSFSKVSAASIKSIKASFTQQNINCRT
ncbi:imidazole glycerol phosphate synthase cyclase subunit [uncultured Desulfosarcina sp.]|uniref:imidazole glycerol phosphate synthase subunit HisF n=1 Tax=uncultured Desulfosarcina sp. TaxID=218289 RepID=UPI0029C6DAAE|nr:imidazole glycerol phosphate synthase cyclase subunit [uncultured Desulfosarcina sp.]